MPYGWEHFLYYLSEPAKPLELHPPTPNTAGSTENAT